MHLVLDHLGGYRQPSEFYALRIRASRDFVILIVCLTVRIILLFIWNYKYILLQSINRKELLKLYKQRRHPQAHLRVRLIFQLSPSVSY